MGVELAAGPSALERVERVDDLEAAWRAEEASGDDLADAAARHHGLRRLGSAELAAGTPRFGDLSRRFLREANLCPLELGDGTHLLAVADPGRRDAMEAVALALGRPLPLAVASFEDLALVFERGEPAAAAPAAELAPALEDTVDTLQDLARGAPIVRLIDDLLERAVELGATDVHLETERDQLRVRLRVDGLLRAEPALPRHLAPAVVSRIKILAGLDIAERRLPQDGRANVRVGAVEAQVRVAIMPTMHGETAVLRVLVKDPRLLELSRIGMEEADRDAVGALLAEPHGLVVVTGPTGSGKTTTLATALGLVNDPSRKIVTVEDPVEYEVAGVHQTQVRPAIGITFASALRAFLRHDPDIIMVGEMRDGETAAIAIQAALTGHLVLTTLHTNSAADAVVRLVDMGVEPYLIGATLRGVVGQRLVRRLCLRCRAERPADDVAAALPAGAARLPPTARTFEARGCSACGGTGYRGRVGIFEVMKVDPGLRALIRGTPDTDALRAAARNNGMRTMLEDGLGKVAAGVTTIDEVLRTVT
ncbi:GspE/PulE family protein [Acuticoccus sp.]|uniref:GspE/PulE family protein n=1 Tax=Acuticoccus sp. TaxID=1904378 RepID=UPI003B52B935